MPSQGAGARDRAPGGSVGCVKRTSSAAVRSTALFALFLLALASCRRSASDYPSGPERTPGITAAPVDAGPSDSAPERAGDEGPEATVEVAPAEAQQPEDSADVEAAGNSESGKDGGASPDAKPDASAEYPLQANPLAGCSLCHVDIEDEFVGSLHFEEKVGCITCHGPSEGHLADENNEVKPDEVFARPDVNRLCERCHECSRPKPPKRELTKDGQRKVCTDCHGAHDVVLVQ